MFFSVLGYGFMGNSRKSNTNVEYNGFEFAEQNGFWNLNLGNLNFVFRYNPKETENISSQVNYLNSYSEKPLYIYSENNEASSEVYINLNQMAQRIQSACLDGYECSENVPIKTCEDNFIIISESNETNIIQENNCVFILGPYENLTMMSDVFLFKVLGVEE